VRQRALGNVLKLVIDGERHGTAGARRRSRYGGRGEAMTANVANELRRAVRAAQQGIERELETIESVSFVVDAAEDGTESGGGRITAIAQRRRVDAAHRRDRRDVFGHETAGQRDPTSLRVRRARHPGLLHARTEERA